MATDRIEVEDARRQIAGGDAQAFDVRGQEAWSDAHIPGAIPGHEGAIEATVSGLEDGQKVIVIADGDPPDEVMSALGDGGFEVAVLDGGMDAWKQADFTVQPTEDLGEDEAEHGTGRDETPA